MEVPVARLRKRVPSSELFGGVATEHVWGDRLGAGGEGVSSG